MKYLIIFLLATNIAFSSDPGKVDNEVKNFCLKEINEALKYNESAPAKDLAIDTKIYRKIFMDESEAFCSCVDKAFSKETKIWGISMYFINPELRFTTEDHCRHEHYKAGTFEVSTILAHKKLQEVIQDRIRDYYIKGIWLLASQDSIARKFLCLEEKVQTKCLKTGSGGISYHCILYTMSDGKVMSKLDDECPSFETVNYSSPMI